MCGGVCSALLLPGLCKEQLGFLHLVVHDSPQLLGPAALFSSLQFLCVLLLEETFVQVQVPQPRVSGPRVQVLPASKGLFLFFHVDQYLDTGAGRRLVKHVSLAEAIRK